MTSIEGLFKKQWTELRGTKKTGKGGPSFNPPAWRDERKEQLLERKDREGWVERAAWQELKPSLREAARPFQPHREAASHVQPPPPHSPPSLYSPAGAPLWLNPEARGQGCPLMQSTKITLSRHQAGCRWGKSGPGKVGSKRKLSKTQFYTVSILLVEFPLNLQQAYQLHLASSRNN